MKDSMTTSFKVLIVLLTSVLHDAHAECSVAMNGGLPDPQPLFLTPDGSLDAIGFKLPSPSGVLSFAPGEEVRLACTGTNNSFRNLDSNQRDIRITCKSGVTFNYDGVRRNIDFFGCSEDSHSATRQTPTRCNNNKNRVIEVGFEINDTEFIKIIEICFDERKLNSIWSKFDLVSVVEGGEVGFDSSKASLTAGNFYSGLDPNNLYGRRMQRSTIGRIIGNLQANHYINSTYYLSRGLLSDGANFVYKTQKLATLYFINAAPQWQTLNVGIWSVVEKRVRNYANQRGVNLIVYTGTHGITTLPDVAKVPTERELYLSVKSGSKQVPVPALYWKVVYEPTSKKGVVLVGVNNPHKNRSVVELNNAMYSVCATKRYISSWYICAAVNQQAGFGYCCEVDDFRNFVTSLPTFEVTDILT